MSNYTAFTIIGKERIRGKGARLNQLITDCKICLPTDPPPSHGDVFFKTYECLWDTGATNTVITKKVITDLNLRTIGKTNVVHGGGGGISDIFMICLRLPNDVQFSFLKVTEAKLKGFDVLIGMDVITQGDFSITNYKGITCFSFRFPSQKKVDFVSERRILELKEKHKGRKGGGKSKKKR